MLSIPTFPEAKHEIIEFLASCSDLELVNLHSAYPDQGRFFTALFCRYHGIVYTTVQHAFESVEQTNYLFAIVWRRIFQQLSQVKYLNPVNVANWQSWIIDIAGSTISQVEVPHPANIRYSLSMVSPPLWCYLEQGLDRIPPLFRLIIVMSQNLNYTDEQICAYLIEEGQNIDVVAIPAHLAEGYQLLEATLPEDIRLIYLNSTVTVVPTST